MAVVEVSFSSKSNGLYLTNWFRLCLSKLTYYPVQINPSSTYMMVVVPQAKLQIPLLYVQSPAEATAQ